MTRSTLFVFRHPPYGRSLAREGLEALLAAAVYEQDIAVLFMNDGVFQLLNDQAPANGQKNHQRMLAALPLYGVETLFVHTPSLTERSLTADDLAAAVQPLTDQDVQRLMGSYDHLLSF